MIYSNFLKKLNSKKFIITAEISPPKGTDYTDMLKKAESIKNMVDAIYITDNQRAVMRMSPIAAASILKNHGYETVIHLTCRDRNRLALQSELLGAYALGINNVMVMSGDHPLKGDHKNAKPVYDLDSVQLIYLIQKLNQGFDLCGNSLDKKTHFCVGAVTNTELNEMGLIKLKKKIKMGIDFINTQAVFDIKSFSKFMDEINIIRSELKSDFKVIAGIIPLRSEKNIKFLTSNIPGIKIPENIINDMKNSSNQEQKGLEIALSLIDELKNLCDGVHIMPINSVPSVLIGFITNLQISKNLSSSAHFFD